MNVSYLKWPSLKQNHTLKLFVYLNLKCAKHSLPNYDLASSLKQLTRSSSKVSGNHDVEHEREHEVDGHVQVGDDEGKEGEDASVAARTKLESWQQRDSD